MEEERLSKDFAIVKELYKESKDLVKQVILFGSVAEGTWNEKSDIDVLFVTGENQTAKLNNRVRKVCKSRGLKIDRDVVLENLREYDCLKSGKRSKVHLLHTQESMLHILEPIVNSVRRGKDITGELNG